MKRLLSISLLVVLLVNGAGFYVYYVVQLQRIHMEARARLKFLPDEALEMLALPKQVYLESRVGDDEVKVHGKMYDIARIEISGDTARIYCVHDEKEDHLFSLLAELISKPLDDGASVPNSVIQFISMSYIVPMHDIVLHNSERDLMVSSRYIVSLGIDRSDIRTPPPKG